MTCFSCREAWYVYSPAACNSSRPLLDVRDPSKTHSTVGTMVRLLNRAQPAGSVISRQRLTRLRENLPGCITPGEARVADALQCSRYSAFRDLRGCMIILGESQQVSHDARAADMVSRGQSSHHLPDKFHVCLEPKTQSLCGNFKGLDLGVISKQLARIRIQAHQGGRWRCPGL